MSQWLVKCVSPVSRPMCVGMLVNRLCSRSPTKIKSNQTKCAIDIQACQTGETPDLGRQFGELVDIQDPTLCVIIMRVLSQTCAGPAWSATSGVQSVWEAMSASLQRAGQQKGDCVYHRKRGMWPRKYDSAVRWLISVGISASTFSNTVLDHMA